jgi:hypothetical protein
MNFNYPDIPDDNVVFEFENNKYFPSNVMKIQTKEIQDWDDDHPLNCLETQKQAYEEMFK